MTLCARVSVVRIFLLALFLAVPIAAAAQSHGGIGVGVKGGPLFSSLTSDVSKDEFKTRTGWIGGLFVGGNRNGVVGAAVELLYARKGAKANDGSGDQIDIDYLEVPVLLRINAGSRSLSGANLYAVVGPAFDIRLKSKLSTGEDLKDQTEGADVGLAVGVGVEITRFLVEARYTKGLRNIASASLDLGEKIKTSTVAIFFGVRFN